MFEALDLSDPLLAYYCLVLGSFQGLGLLAGTCIIWHDRNVHVEIATTQLHTFVCAHTLQMTV